MGWCGTHWRHGATEVLSGFFGTFDHLLDEKGRVSLPKAFRRGDGGEPFVLLQWKAPAITLFPPDAWLTVQERLLEYRASGDDAWLEVMALAGQARDATPDKLWRILIPKAVQQQGSLEGPVRLVGNIDRIEIWNPAAHDEVMSGTTEKIRQFANKIFG